MLKRSRAGDAAFNSHVQLKGERSKRRCTSRGEDEVGKHPGTVLAANPSSAIEPISGPEGIIADNSDEKNVQQPKSWSLSRSIAGYYSNLDPLFSNDEQYLFLSVETAIHIYSAATSRLFRVLPISPRSSIIGYKFSPINHEHMYILTSSGSVSEWEWAVGKHVAQWDTHHNTIGADLIYGEPADDKPVSLVSLRERSNKKREITLACLGGEKPLTQVILETDTKIKHLRVTGQGRTIVTYGGAHVYLGTASSSHTIETLQYTWREVKLPFSITCIDIKQNEVSKGGIRPGMDCNTSVEDLDFAFGGADGSILIYHDMLGFVGLGGSAEGDNNRAPRRLHWHRDHVMTVCWSQDGNYIISGGRESVMVLYQLDTGRKQFLPHLSSAICNIVISPTGNLYAAKLADNRVIVLSAREMQPSLSITGLQLCPRTIKPTGQPTTNGSLPFRAVTSILHPQNPDQLLIAVPTAHHAMQEGLSLTTSPILQTYDIRSNNHLSRQALARTNATTLNISPNGTQLVTPDVKHLDVSYDGKWMATIDTWCPHHQDVSALGLENSGSHNVLSDFQEIHLKFWRWNRSGLWELFTRIEGPHFSDKGPVPVLDLAARAHSPEFVTIGSDAVLRFWRPNVKPQSGLKSDNADQSTETWKCRNTLDLDGYIGDPNSSLTSAFVCCSEDGSVVAVCLQSASVPAGLAILIDAQSGKVRYSRVGIYSGDLCAMSFLGSRLIIATNRSVFIWDTVSDVVMTTGLPGDKLLDGTEHLLAVNVRTQTLAVASWCTQKKAASKRSRKFRPSIRVYDAQSVSLLSQFTLTKDPVALHSNLHSNDYVVVDSAANVYRLGCLTRVPQSINTDGIAKESESGLACLFGHHRLDSVPAPVTTANTYSRGLEGAGLAGVFANTPPFVLPPSRIIFRDVVKALMV